MNSLAAPRPGDRTTVTLWTASGKLSLEADVAYVERTIGFGVKFLELTPQQRTQIDHLMVTAAKASA